MKILKQAALTAAFFVLSAPAYCADRLPFNLVTRAQWGAQWVDFNQVASIGIPTKFTLHHSAGAYPASLEAAKATMRQIQSEVMSWGTDVAYHYIISPQGDVFEGIPENKLGTHAYNDNYNNIGICFMGNYMNDNPTPKSLDAFVNLVRYLIDKYPAMAKRVSQQNDGNPKNRFFILHRETYATLCPGDKLVALQGELFGRMVSREMTPAEYNAYSIVPVYPQETGSTGSAYLDLLQSTIAGN